MCYWLVENKYNPTKGFYIMSDDGLSDEDKKLFRQSVGKVKPLAPMKKNHPTPRPAPPVKRRQTPLPVTRNVQWGLSDYVAEPVGSDDKLFWSAEPLPAKRLKDLRDGRIPWQARLDLHGLTGDEARTRLQEFMELALENEWRCVLIIHGKGGYHGAPPVIKNLVNQWLRQLPMVRAYHSANKRHGSNGAVYVLLKK